MAQQLDEVMIIDTPTLYRESWTLLLEWQEQDD